MSRFAVVPLLAIATFGSSCAAMLKDWQDSHCNYDGAYSDGMAAQRAHEEPNAGRYGQCTPETREVAMRGYREGYESAARAQAQAEAEAAQKWQDANCNYDAAFAQGINAQHAGAAMDIAPYGVCAEPSRSEAMRGYRIGYERAMREAARESRPPVVVQPPPGPVVVPPPPPGPVVAPPPAISSRLVSAANGKCLDAGGGPKADGTLLQLWQCNDTDAQMFALRPTGTGAVNIVHTPTGLCVDAGTPEYRTRLRRCAGVASQTFTRAEMGSAFQLIEAGNGRCLDVDHNSSNDGTPIVQWMCHGGANQQWTMPVVTPRP